MNKVERPPTPDSPTETPQLSPDNAPHKAAPDLVSSALVRQAARRHPSDLSE